VADPGTAESGPGSGSEPAAPVPAPVDPGETEKLLAKLKAELLGDDKQ
jgi:hypothetical protein